MKITNTHNLPQPLYDAICSDEYRRAGTFSASELPKPPQIRVLENRHRDEIVKDAADFLWIIQGKSIHKLLEGGKGANDMREESLVEDIGDGVTISGTTDLYTGSVVDWKVTSVWSYLLGGLKPEWEAQLNVYSWLWRKHGFETKEAAIWAVLRDWQKSKALAGGDYPAIPFMRIPVPIWEDGVIEAYIRGRVAEHLAAEKLQDAELPPCSETDQWARPATYAVKKEGRKTAVRVFDVRSFAEELAEELGAGHTVEDRPGVRTRCEGYCDARPFCAQYAREAVK